jgi:hypothetical protein
MCAISIIASPINFPAAEIYFFEAPKHWLGALLVTETA